MLDGTSATNPTELALGSSATPGTGLNEIDNTAVFSFDFVGGITPGDFLGSKLTTTSLATIAATSSVTPIGTEIGGLGVIQPTVNPFLKTTVVTDYTLANSIHQIGYSGSLFNANSAQHANGWLFSDATNIEVNVTPEPSSIVLWSGFLGMLAVRAYRRRKSA